MGGMMRAICTSDLVTGLAGGDADGPEVPAELAGLSCLALRYDGETVVDVRAKTDWHIDAAGQKRLAPAAGRQPLACRWDAALKRDDVGTWSVRTPADMLAPLTSAKRWRTQIGGTAAGVPTDEASRAAVAQAIQSIDLGIITAPVAWKTPAGFVNLGRAELLGLAQAMAAHVQDCFDVERDVLAAINAGTITTREQIDAAPWPANG